MSLAIDCATMYIKNFYHTVAPDKFPQPILQPGRPLSCETEGSITFLINQIITDSSGQAYRIIDLIGSGSYGSVFKCQLISNPEIFLAIKVIKNQPQYMQSGLNEVSMLSQVSQLRNHPGLDFILLPITTFELNGHMCIVSPLLQHSLFEGIYNNQSLSSLLDSIRNIMRNLLLALDAVHSCGIIHGDVKTDNILKINDTSDDICLIDFGSASNTNRVGKYFQSRFYRSPEVILSLPYTTQIDMWSAGCVAAELFLDFAPFSCDNEYDLIHTIVALIGQIPDDFVASSPKWQHFYNYTPMGFNLKSNAIRVVLDRHLNKSIFIERGPMNLAQLVMTRFEPQSREEYESVVVFSSFLHGLLSIDPNSRMTARQALMHPFINTSSPLNFNINTQPIIHPINNFSIQQQQQFQFQQQQQLMQMQMQIQQQQHMQINAPILPPNIPSMPFLSPINSRCPSFIEMF
ncbi:CMGC family protein kinase [Tritrichomonas foetus]|uniref:CMGC family protein kinase n=1 Tax=Tritrichomonas foetus TaxID=1144522 RepID=A0A1J4KGH4_9EUKA|nr:CMGC family protein kinase [Tritrichomonas foetus]|eukprot:OHT10503.1 CMGC family protein kinase [Tritrichomonas foetus]